MEQYFETDYARISFDSDCNYILLDWLDQPTSTEYRECKEKLLASFSHFKNGKVVSDTIHTGALLPSDQEWTGTEWMKRAREAGHSHVAFIFPKDVFTLMSLEGIFSYQDSVSTGHFDTLEAAVGWIKEQ